jgi:hypothetical protein
MYQELAKAHLPSWRLYQRHQVEFFSLSMLPQLRAMVDTMHEGRFDIFMQEVGGLTEGELRLFIDVCMDIIEFQRVHFPTFAPIVPLNALLAIFIIYRKILALKKDFRTLLEIGPGCGYLPFFLKRQHRDLVNYSQIEAAESFYLLQHHISEYLYGARFGQKVFPNEGSFARFYGSEFIGVTSEPAERVDSVIISPPAKPKVVFQHPWWRIGELMTSNAQFEIVMSNANLLEFTPVALKDYLTLINAKLAPNGLFFVQCFGGGVGGGPEGIPVALQRLYEFGFAPLFLALRDEGMVKGSARWMTHGNYMGIKPGDKRAFTLSNAVFINNKHELFEEYYRRENYRDFFFAPLPNLREAFFADTTERRLYSKTELTDALLKALS